MSIPTIKSNGIVKKTRIESEEKKKEKIIVRTGRIPRVGFGVNRITDSNGPRTS